MLFKREGEMVRLLDNDLSLPVDNLIKTRKRDVDHDGVLDDYTLISGNLSVVICCPPFV